MRFNPRGALLYGYIGSWDVGNGQCRLLCDIFTYPHMS